MTPLRIMTINDMSGYGRCSLTVALPILGVMGMQCCPLPTAWLSAHTGIPGYTFHDLTAELRPAYAHWKSLGVNFDAVYSGFLGSQAQIDIVAEILAEQRRRGALIVVDPVMADRGAVYATYTKQMCADMVRLAEAADVITPNPTEAAILLGMPLDAEPAGEAEAARWVRALSRGGQRCVVLTGLSFDGGRMGACCYDRYSDEIAFPSCFRVPAEFPGTGDIFASVLLGGLLLGSDLKQATEVAVRFVHDCMELTLRSGAQPEQGVCFEPLLFELGRPDRSGLTPAQVIRKIDANNR